MGSSATLSPPSLPSYTETTLRSVSVPVGLFSLSPSDLICLLLEVDQLRDLEELLH